MASRKKYFIVNPGGAIHEVQKEHAQRRLAYPGWRLAKPFEIKKLEAAGGNQTAERPLCKPWTPLVEIVEDPI